MDEKKKVYKLYKEVVEKCQYCPKNESGWSETHCLKEKPARVITKKDTKPFPEWCKLEDFDGDIGDNY